MWTGSYHYPAPTFLSSVYHDVITIDKVIGVGELAISDHRSSWPTQAELERIASDARVGGLLSGKAGKVHTHMGSGKQGLQPLIDVVEATEIPITQFHPTHTSGRGEPLLSQARQWVADGGVVDMTADDKGNNATISALVQWRAAGVDLSRVTVSTDAYGSYPTFNSEGVLVGYTVGHPDTLLKTIQTLVLKHQWPLQDALALFTTNTATFLSFAGKGVVEAGADGDLVVLDGTTLDLEYVLAKGDVVRTPTWTKKSMFEK
eukprot:GFYU01029092.1.p1 GENE.GFYU01029092.1~~GFYU01029092.1.p1  ORF type:complete len:261 (-),score=61.08 GFYU01029092.1:55-837(-)